MRFNLPPRILAPDFLDSHIPQGYQGEALASWLLVANAVVNNTLYSLLLPRRKDSTNPSTSPTFSTPPTRHRCRTPVPPASPRKSTGRSNSRRIAASLVLMFGYLLAATYFIKLLPLYSGYEGRASLAALSRLYASQTWRMVEDLGMVALAPGKLIVALATLAVVLIVVLQAALARHLFRPQ